MAVNRPKIYKNFVPPDTGKVYQISGNADGTSRITDVTPYISEGDNWTAADANMIWDELEKSASDESVVLKTGSTMTGPLIAGGEQTLSLAQMRNVIIDTAEIEDGAQSSEPIGTIHLVYEV